MTAVVLRGDALGGAGHPRCPRCKLDTPATCLCLRACGHRDCAGSLLPPTRPASLSDDIEAS